MAYYICIARAVSILTFYIKPRLIRNLKNIWKYFCKFIIFVSLYFSVSHSCFVFSIFLVSASELIRWEKNDMKILDHLLCKQRVSIFMHLRWTTRFVWKKNSLSNSVEHSYFNIILEKKLIFHHEHTVGAYQWIQ